MTHTSSSSSRKERLDKLLVDRGLCASRAQAQALVMDGKVRVDGQPVHKPGTLIHPEKAEIELAALSAYVSRGGLKLEKALSVFAVEPAERICIDVGASTGGFTDCLLQRGAVAVVAVDVGYGQLDWKLRQDPRVKVMEKTNIRTLTPEQLPLLPSAPSLGVVDASFISLKKTLPPLSSLLTTPADIIALLKPQFEHRDYVTDRRFKGVVHGADNYERILQGVLADLDGLLPDWRLVGLDFSPITGPKGNVEYLVHYVRRPPDETPESQAAEEAPLQLDGPARSNAIRAIIAQAASLSEAPFEA